MRADELEQVLVAADEHDVEVVLEPRAGRGGEQVVGLDPLLLDDRDPVGPHQVPDDRDLRHQPLGHRRPRRLVLREVRVAGRRPLRVERHGEVVRLLLAHDLQQHRREAVDRVGREALGVREVPDRVERPVDVGVPVDQVEPLALARHRRRPPVRFSGCPRRAPTSRPALRAAAGSAYAAPVRATDRPTTRRAGRRRTARRVRPTSRDRCRTPEREFRRAGTRSLLKGTGPSSPRSPTPARPPAGRRRRIPGVRGAALPARRCGTSTRSCAASGEFASLAFCNGGVEAGASQPHKHLQRVPLPLAPEGPAGADRAAARARPPEAPAKSRSSPASIFVHAFVRFRGGGGGRRRMPTKRSGAIRALLGHLGLAPLPGAGHAAPARALLPAARPRAGR